jgi:hypothetical protein
MSTEPDRLMIGNKSIAEGTSLFFEQTNEVAWVQELCDGYVHMICVNGPFKMDEQQFVKKIHADDIAVESRPPDRNDCL